MYRSTCAPPDERAVIFLWPNASLFIGRPNAQHAHAHPCVEVTIDLDDRLELELTRPAESTGVHEAVMVAPNVVHAIRFRGARHATLWVELASRLACRLWQGPGEGHWRSMDRGWVANARRGLRALDAGPSSHGATSTLCDILHRLVQDRSAAPVLDPRVKQALQLLNAIEDDALPAATIAAAVGLSESRLRHLFRERLGVTIRRYRSWVRLVHALVDAMGRSTLTDAAHRWGFVDSSHLTRAAHALTGIPPSEIIRARSFDVIAEPIHLSRA